MKFKHYKKFVSQFWRGAAPKAVMGDAVPEDAIVTADRDGFLVEHDARALFTMTLGLCTEAGEAGDCVKKLVRGKGFDIDALQLELGDVLYYLVKIHQEFGLDIAETMAKNVAKLEARRGR